MVEDLNARACLAYRSVRIHDRITREVPVAPFTLLGIAGLWLTVAAVLAGIGLLVMRLSGVPQNVRGWFWLAFWSGFGLSMALLELWHFFAPISWVSSAVLSLCGATGWWLCLRSKPASHNSVRSVSAFIVGGFLLLWMANRATGPADQFDAGLYHIPATQWAVAARELPGLGNLHYRMAFSTLYYPFVASFETLGVPQLSTHVANAMLLSAVLLMQVGSLRRLFRTSSFRPSDAGLTTSLPMTLFYAISKDASSINTDVPTFCVAIATTWMMLRLVEVARWGLEGDEGEAERELGPLLLASLVGCATLLVLKLSVLPLAIGLALAACLTVWRRTSSSATSALRRGVRRTIVAGIAVGAFMVSCWVVRSVIVSGHLVFPISQTRLPLSHSVPAELTRAVMTETSDYPRYWLPRKFVAPLLRRVPVAPVAEIGASMEKTNRRSSISLRVLALVATTATYGFLNLPLPLLAAFALVLIARLAVRRDSRESEREFHHQVKSICATFRWLWVPAACCLTYWLIGAPDPRFATAASWSLAGTFVAVAAAMVNLGKSKRVTLWRNCFMLVLAGSLCAVIAFRIVYLRINSYYASTPLTSLFWISAPEDGGLHPALKDEFEEFVTDSGLVLYVPPTQMAWWGPLPSSPKKPKGLAAREGNDPFSGFEMRSMPDRLTSDVTAE